MASGRICTAGFLFLIFSQVIWSTTADYDEPEQHARIEDDTFTTSCSAMNGLNLGDGCSISDDCSTITCNMDFVKKPITFKLKINKCDSPVSVTATMDVPDLGITWSNTYTSDDIVEVPGFAASLPDIFSAGVFVQVKFTNNDDTDQLNLKVNLLAGAKFFDHGTYPVSVTVLDGDLPISTDDCGFFGWWFDLNDIAKAAVIGGPILLIIIIACCCCCCCGCCRSRPANQGTVVIAPGAPTAVRATSTRTTVPMRPLVEEA